MRNPLYDEYANPGAHPIPGGVRTFSGMTKLEAFTMAAMQGMCAASGISNRLGNSPGEVSEAMARGALRIAKATLDALQKEKQ